MARQAEAGAAGSRGMMDDLERLPALLGTLIGLLRERQDDDLAQAFHAWVGQVLLAAVSRAGAGVAAAAGGADDA